MRALAVVVPLLLVCGCGYVGDPLPPALNIPSRITNLAAIERGDHIVLTFTTPALTTENLPIRVLGTPQAQVGDRVLDLKAPKPGAGVREEIPAKEWVGRKIPIKVRLHNGKGMYSEWSNEVSLDVTEPLPTPASVAAAADPRGVRVTWQSPSRAGLAWRVYRDDEQTPIVVDKPEFIDAGAGFGKEHKYRVQATLGQAESEVSPVASITVARDEFPPAVPTGLAGLQGIDSIELNWDPNTETDLKGYRVYRSVNGGATEAVGDTETPSFSDKKITGNQSYRYSVTALDQVGNESGKSQVIEIKTR